jgi:hypothetical protein
VHRQAGVGEDVQHRPVLAQRRRGERRELLLPGPGDQVLEQQGGDAPVVQVVGHRERDLRGAGLGGAGLGGQGRVAGAAGQLAAGGRQQGHLARRRVTADPPGLYLGRHPADIEEAHIGVIRGHRRVHGLDRVEVVRGGRADLDRRQQRVHLARLRRLAHLSSLPQETKLASLRESTYRQKGSFAVCRATEESMK